MKINILRGQNQIGGSIIELSTDNTRIILDVGANLGESKSHPYVPPAAGLFDVGQSYDAVFVSHYHSDHTGLLRFVRSDNPIYMGKRAFEILDAINEYKGKETGFNVNYLYSFEKITVGDFTVTPIPCDHSAYSAYMFLIEAEGKTVLYSADYRASGHLNFDVFLEMLPSKVDVLLTEGTTLSRGEDFHEPSEIELEDFAVDILEKKTGPSFVYLSAQNVDRILTAYHAAQRTGRRFILDGITSAVAEAAELELDALELGKDFDLNSPAFASPDFMLCVTPQTLMNLEKLSNLISFKDGVLFFGRRQVYMLKPVTAVALKYLEAQGLTVPMLHTSGHADAPTIERLIRHVQPDILIPIHTENAAWFEKYEMECEVVFNCHEKEI
ncbi:MAG: MBL fold metallo-hydrolase [Bacillota bacterium]|nr:MBL fold metallo-hydrolase [Bacillota bacterium]